MEQSSSRRNSIIKASTVPDLAEITEENDEENQENVTEEEEDMVFGRSEQLTEENDAMGRDMFGFTTPRKGKTSMAQKVAEEMNRTPLSQKNTPNVTPNKFATPTRSASNTPVKGILKTPTSRGKRPRIEPDTPASTRKKVRQTLIRIAEKEETKYFSASDTDEEEEAGGDSQESEEEEVRYVISGPPPTPQTPARRGRKGIKQARDLNTDQLADSYFDAHSSKVMTSDRTLSKLKTPRLSEADVKNLLSDSKLPYEAEVRELLEDHRVQFPKWLSLLHQGFSIVTYGLGSKKSLIHDFHAQYLLDQDCVVVNGFFPSLTIKSVLNTITDDILELDGSSASNVEQIEDIFNGLEDQQVHLYLLVHNIDGVTLRNEKSQSVLACLAAHPRVHLVCSIDHINAPLVWDQDKLAKLNLIWFDCTSFLPYSEETGGGHSLMVKQSGALALSSLSSVWASLTPNAKKIYTIIIRYQMENMEAETTDGYSGFSFMELYRMCRLEFLVPSDLALRAQLTEFRDHKLVKSRKGNDGGEYLTIPLDKATLAAFMENIEGK